MDARSPVLSAILSWLGRLNQTLRDRFATPEDASLPATILLAFFVGLAGGAGALVFGWWIKTVGRLTLEPVFAFYAPLTVLVPVVGLLLVAWLTRRFAPEAQGHGVPEVIGAVARGHGVIRPRVAAVKTLASGLTIGMGGSVGREGPIVQIGSATGSVFGQLFKLPERNVKVLVAAGAAAGISATFGAPLAGVMFAAEIILGNFAVSSLTPIVIAAVLANLVAQNGILLLYGHPWLEVEGDRVINALHAPVAPVFHEAANLNFDNPATLLLYLLLGLLCGVVAVGFTKMVYAVEDFSIRWMPRWYLRAIVCGLLVGVIGLLFLPASKSLFGVGYLAVRQALAATSLDGAQLSLAVLTGLWLLKYLAASITLAGGGSGGIFAPSLFLGAMFGGVVGHLAAMLFPGLNIQPGAFSLVGMAAVVAGTTHGPMSAVLILFEMTHDYNLILPLMCAAGLASVVSRLADPESIYIKKLSRRGELTAWGHHTTGMEDVYVRDLMITTFPSVPETATLADIVEIATKNPHNENLPVMGGDGKLLGIIRAEDLHRMLDTDIQPELVLAQDIVQRVKISLSPEDNLLHALREFGHLADVECLPVVIHTDGEERLIGLLPRANAIRRYRREMLRHHSGKKADESGR